MTRYQSPVINSSCIIRGLVIVIYTLYSFLICDNRWNRWTKNLNMQNEPKRQTTSKYVSLCHAFISEFLSLKFAQQNEPKTNPNEPNTTVTPASSRLLKNESVIMRDNSWLNKKRNEPNLSTAKIAVNNYTLRTKDYGPMPSASRKRTQNEAKRTQIIGAFVSVVGYTAAPVVTEYQNQTKPKTKMDKQRLFISDLDGTLLRGDAALSEYSRTTLCELLAAGLHFTVASARTWHEMVQVLGDIPLTLPVIAINGAYITDYRTGEHLVINNMAPELAAAVCEQTLKAGLSPFIVTFNGTEDCLYWQELKNEEMQWYHDILHVQKDQRLRRTEDLKYVLAETVIAFAVLGPRQHLFALWELLAAEYPGMLENFLFENPYTPGHWWLTIHDQKVCKSKAVRTLTEMTGHKLENLTVFGDHVNDIKMLKTAGTGIAVANAEEALKQYADQIIGPNEEDAVVRYLVEYSGVRATL